jgi:glyceraldehyde 3-phosphate dehydrogenase
MTTNVGINGFGRIGRQVLKAIIERHSDKLRVVAVNDLFDVKTNAHLFKFDSNYGRFAGTVDVKGDSFVINGNEVKSFSSTDPAKIPWKSLGAEVVIESTGAFTEAAKAKSHIDGGGAKKVIISAPAKGEDITVVIGVNHEKYDPAKHNIISNASCTTNCLAPPAFVLNKVFGIEKGLMDTVHSYTNDQRLLDRPHRDLRRARAAALNMIPTTTGAAKALALVIPELAGKFDGLSMRVPTPTVSVVDFTATLKKSTTKEGLRGAFKEASETYLKDIMGFEEQPLVSMDFKGCSLSSIVDSEFCHILGGDMVKVLAWYDNEWGYSCRVSDLAALVADKGL